MPIAGLPALLGLLSKHGKEKKRVHFPYLPGYSAKHRNMKRQSSARTMWNDSWNVLSVLIQKSLSLHQNSQHDYQRAYQRS